ncbi:MAG: glycosyltransferase family 4 protein [Lachnospiraceae bacterium]|nr:glycosyltransferase family 4 protein [Lachnospiraceae bacterium]
MKILMVNKFLYPNGGSETYIFKLGEQLQKCGHAVQYFGMEHEGRIVGNHAESYTSNMDFHTGKLQKLLYPFRIIYSVEARKKIRVVLEDFQPDAVHLNNINFQITPSILYEIRSYERAKGKKIQIVFTAHDYQWVCPNHMMRVPASGEVCFACKGGNFGQCAKRRCIHNSWIKSLLGTIEASYYAIRKTYGMVDTIICPSLFMKEQLDTNPLLADKTVVLRNFIDTNVTKLSAKNSAEKISYNKNARTASGYVVFFGRFSEEKGVRTLLDACKALPDISFIFAGAGSLEKEVNQIKNIENRGFIIGEELKKLITEARFSVYPSEWYENCPFSVMESQMYGTPVIASNLGGTKELVEKGVTGELFSGGNVKELASHIRKLWDDPELCQKYSRNCSKIKFDTVEEYCDKIVKIYQGGYA